MYVFDLTSVKTASWKVFAKLLEFWLFFKFLHQIWRYSIFHWLCERYFRHVETVDLKRAESQYRADFANFFFTFNGLAVNGSWLHWMFVIECFHQHQPNKICITAITWGATHPVKFWNESVFFPYEHYHSPVHYPPALFFYHPPFISLCFNPISASVRYLCTGATNCSDARLIILWEIYITICEMLVFAVWITSPLQHERWTLY